ncbi:ABC transporter permease [Rugosimonospora africana]|uniref:Sugar ABC transporter permease n=1 Tax=Rugosimonospora africana TaxID=556532 RepID=A0A8J3VPC5_9ACTN|nr:ABC transporter permease [Rugosimonospora africana]GIH13827.1 sugar ABC transporter permease [Rugosimonospora africana]
MTATEVGVVEENGGAVEPPSASLSQRLLGANALWTFLILVGLVVFFTIAAPSTFLTQYDITQIATNAAIYLVLGVGMTFVIITGGIDLSVGSVLILSGVLAAEYVVHHGGYNAHWPSIIVGIVISMATGTAWGVLQGFVCAKAKVPPLIVTLGGLGMALGIARIITTGNDVAGGAPNALVETLGLGKLFGVIPWIVIVAVLCTVVFGLVLAYTRFGRYTYAIGSNAEAARRVGIKVERKLIQVYALSGLMAGIAGVMSLAFFHTTTIAGHSTDNLAVITAVVMGGTSLFGGRGTIVGTVIGVFIPAVLNSGLVIIGVQQYWQDVAVGAVLVFAVYLDQLRRRSRERS